MIPIWQYQVNCYTVRKKKEIFIMDERTTIHLADTAWKLVYHYVMVSCCVDCPKFQFFLNASVWQSLNGVHCRNVAQDNFVFGHSYHEEIFMGELANHFEQMNDGSKSECEETITFPEEPLKKSCFTDSKLDYNIFCSVCRESFREKFERDLFVFQKIDDDEKVYDVLY